MDNFIDDAIGLYQTMSEETWDVDRPIDITTEQRKTVLAMAQTTPAEHHGLGLWLPRQVDRTPTIRPGLGGIRQA